MWRCRMSASKQTNFVGDLHTERTELMCRKLIHNDAPIGAHKMITEYVICVN